MVPYITLNPINQVTLGGVYKPRGQMRGKGVAQMTTTLNNSYQVKVSTYLHRGGGQNCTKFCPRGLYTAPRAGAEREPLVNLESGNIDTSFID